MQNHQPEKLLRAKSQCETNQEDRLKLAKLCVSRTESTKGQILRIDWLIHSFFLSFTHSTPPKTHKSGKQGTWVFMQFSQDTGKEVTYNQASTVQCGEVKSATGTSIIKEMEMPQISDEGLHQLSVFITLTSTILESMGYKLHEIEISRYITYDRCFLN